MNYRIVIVAEYSQQGEHWIEKELQSLGKNYLFIDDVSYNAKDYEKKYGRIIYWTKYVKLANKTLKKTCDDDIIVTLTFTVGLITSLLSKITGKRRRILALNLISYDHSRLDFIKKPLFRYLFLKNDLISTVNSEEYIRKYNNKFSLNNEKVLYLLNDPINPRFIIDNSKPSIKEKGDKNFKCFSGGEANRDWNTVVECAKNIQNATFTVIARKYKWDYKGSIPPNINLDFDKENEYFINALLESDIVIVPLKDDMVAGLTVFIQAMAMKKLVLISDIPATRKYVPNGCENILIPLGDYKGFIEKLEYFIMHPEESTKLSEKLYSNLMEKFSPEMYTKNIIRIIEDSFIK